MPGTCGTLVAACVACLYPVLVIIKFDIPRIVVEMNYDVQRARTHVLMKEKSVLNQFSSQSHGIFCDEDNIWDLSKWSENFKIDIINYNDTDMEFDLIGLQAPIVNAFRRILLSDVPSMAIEKVLVYNNTSLLQDEVLAHRLGLVPLHADSRKFEFRQPDSNEGTEVDTLKFELKIKCSWNRNIPESDKVAPHERQENTKVYSSHITWLPIGNQAHMFKADDVGAIHEDILIAKMVPGQELDLQLHAVKGTGRDHAKFSPVATASYRLLPEITLLKPVEGEQAARLQKCFSPGVIALEETKSGKTKAVVANARLDSCSRNVFRYEDLKDAVKLERVKHHFIFTVESVGALPPDVLFVEAVKILKNKCKALRQDLKGMKLKKKGTGSEQEMT